MEQENLLTQKELCYELRCTRASLWNWRNKGMPYVLQGTNHPMYSLNDVCFWLMKNRLEGGIFEFKQRRA